MKARFAQFAQSLEHQPWRLWLAQAMTIGRMELRKNFLSRRGVWVYLLAYAPAIIIGIHDLADRRGQLAEDTQVLAGIFQLYYVRLAIFFGCMGIFTRLIRGEMVERSLHYYLLSPVRRELMVVAKFAAGLITSVFFFATGVAASFYLMYVPYGAAGTQFMSGPGQHHIRAYLLVTVLACMGYGAVFLALSIVFKNPMMPGVVMLGWETINPVLPALLQKISIIYYLRHLQPVQVPAEGIFALLTVVTEPVAAWAATLGIFILSAAVLIFACWRVRTLEISYTTD